MLWLRGCSHFITPPNFFLEIRVIIKIVSNPCYPRIYKIFDKECSKKIFNLFEFWIWELCCFKKVKGWVLLFSPCQAASLPPWAKFDDFGGSSPPPLLLLNFEIHFYLSSLALRSLYQSILKEQASCIVVPQLTKALTTGRGNAISPPWLCRALSLSFSVVSVSLFLKSCC